MHESITEFISITTLLLAIPSIIITIEEWKRKNKLKHVEFVEKLTDKLRYDIDIVKAMHDVEYWNNWYNEDFHKCEEIEQRFDKLFSFLSYICYLREIKVLSKKDFEWFEYKLERASIDPDTQAYLNFIISFAAKQNANHPYHYLKDWGDKRKNKYQGNNSQIKF